jgi:sucrose-6-phosphate hydrolase SacC (GH32 family)
MFLNGTWHVFPDGGPHGWAHFTSPDLLNWTEHSSALANGDTGSVSLTDQGIIALYPTTGHSIDDTGLMRQIPTGPRTYDIAPDVAWQPPTGLVAKNPGLGAGFRDPSRALLMQDGSWYVGVGTGFGGENPKTGLPGSGTGCLAWMKAKNGSLSEFEFVGCLLNNTHTDGHIDPR